MLSKPYDYFFVNLIVPEESPINKLEDLDGKTLDPIVPTDGRYVAIHDWLKRHPDVNITVPEVTNQSTFQDSSTPFTMDPMMLCTCQRLNMRASLTHSATT